MTDKSAKTHVPYTADQMFALVADVERYPEFVPHCRALRVLSGDVKTGTGVCDAEMIVAYHAFRERFRCRVTLDKARHAIDAAYLDGPFRTLTTAWKFHPEAEGCLIDFTVAFEFKSFLLQATAAAVFERAFVKMSDAFVARADAIYGRSAVR